MRHAFRSIPGIPPSLSRFLKWGGRHWIAFSWPASDPSTTRLRKKFGIKILYLAMVQISDESTQPTSGRGLSPPYAGSVAWRHADSEIGPPTWQAAVHVRYAGVQRFPLSPSALRSAPAAVTPHA